MPTTVAYPGTDRLIISGKTEATEASKRNRPGSDSGDEKSSSRPPGEAVGDEEFVMDVVMTA